MKKYEFGMICGRFSHIHNGHKILIEKGLQLCNKVLILVGSAQENNTLRNPFSAEYRIKLIKKIYNNDNLIIEKLDDMTNEYDISYDWGEYVINNTKKHIGRFADLIITGNDDLRKGWFSEEQLKDTEELIVDRKLLDISATKLRGYIIVNDKEKWKKYVPEEIHEDFDEIRKKILKVESYRKILEEMKNDITINNYKKIYKKYEEIDKINKKMNK